MYAYLLQRIGRRRRDDNFALDSFREMRRVEWDTLLFFFGIIFAVAGLGVAGYLALLSNYLYGNLGPTFSNIAIGVLGAAFDNIPLMFTLLTMNPDMSSGQWMLATLSIGVGGMPLPRLDKGGEDGARVRRQRLGNPSAGKGNCCVALFTWVRSEESRVGNELCACERALVNGGDPARGIEKHAARDRQRLPAFQVGAVHDFHGVDEARSGQSAVPIGRKLSGERA